MLIMPNSGCYNKHIIGWMTYTTKHLFVTVLETKKSKLKVPDNLTPHEDPYSGLQKPIFLPYTHMVERLIISLLCLFIRTLILLRGAPPS